MFWCNVCLSSEMLQFVSNQVGDFPDLFEDHMTQAGSLQSNGAGSAPQAAAQTHQTPPAAVYQSPNPSLASSQSLSPQCVPPTPPLTPAQSPPTIPAATVQQHQVTRSPPLLQPRPPAVQPIQPQPQPTAQPTIQVETLETPFQILRDAWKCCWITDCLLRCRCTLRAFLCRLTVSRSTPWFRPTARPPSPSRRRLHKPSWLPLMPDSPALSRTPSFAIRAQVIVSKVTTEGDGVCMKFRL